MGKRVGNAVRRNLVKRRLRQIAAELDREGRLGPGRDRQERVPRRPDTRDLRECAGPAARGIWPASPPEADGCLNMILKAPGPGSHRFLPAVSFSVLWPRPHVPIPSNLFRIRSGRGRKIRRLQGRLADDPTHRPVSSTLSRRVRPGTLKGHTVNSARACPVKGESNLGALSPLRLVSGRLLLVILLAGLLVGSACTGAGLGITFQGWEARRRSGTPSTYPPSEIPIRLACRSLMPYPGR